MVERRKFSDIMVFLLKKPLSVIHPDPSLDTMSTAAQIVTKRTAFHFGMFRSNAKSTMTVV
ncbi:hypothetical protein IscW_ISCW008800 [Ixodes scapularis]|uniref:Uncharacterized protein n=1 Tax=Ixodes scapularis TaxID=6945 RepID=B7Q2G5_IXOSC|nr:hypothetical protein IscW_ISCW008800 [Ixodes scapularis]|eukprot:XP_002410781.1 hypothetical protein IscW_ISCW008800 [Ixodes scapularis]